MRVHSSYAWRRPAGRRRVGSWPTTRPPARFGVSPPLPQVIRRHCHPCRRGPADATVRRRLRQWGHCRPPAHLFAVRVPDQHPGTHDTTVRGFGACSDLDRSRLLPLNCRPRIRRAMTFQLPRDALRGSRNQSARQPGAWCRSGRPAAVAPLRLDPSEASSGRTLRSHSGRTERSANKLPLRRARRCPMPITADRWLGSGAAPVQRPTDRRARPGPRRDHRPPALRSRSGPVPRDGRSGASRVPRQSAGP